MNTHEENLDRLAAVYSQKMIGVIGLATKKETKPVEAAQADTLYTKALGVLQEHGLYALALYLLYRSGNQMGTDSTKYEAEELIATQTLALLLQLLGEEVLSDLQVKPEQIVTWDQLNARQQKDAILVYISSRLCASDLGRLLFIKELFSQTLTYARYHARALRE